MGEIVNQARLYLSVFIDNSPSMTTANLNQLLDGFAMLFKRFEREQEEQTLRINVMTFGDFQPLEIKSRDEKGFTNELIKDGFPLLGRSITQMVKALTQTLSEDLAPLHTPWVIVISNGLSLDSLKVSHSALKALKTKFNLRYLPFLTTREKVASRQVESDQFESKKPMIILDQKMDLFFHWLSEDIHNRITTPLDERVKSDKKLLEGWTIL
jgi:uncharacterized protein YegL